MSESDDHWANLVAHAKSERDLPTLAQVIVTRSLLLTRPDFAKVDAGRHGRPYLKRAKEAGAALLDLIDSSSPPEHSWAYRGLALSVINGYSPTAATGRREAMRRHRDDLRMAAATVRDKDPLLELYLLDLLTQRERDCDDRAGALAAAGRMVTLAEQTEALDRSLLTALLPEGVLRPIATAVSRYHVQAYMRAYLAARYARDYRSAVVAADARIIAAEQLVSGQPNLLAQALGVRAGIARALGDLTTNAAMRERQRAVVAAHPTALARRVELVSRSDEAQYFDDFDGQRQALLERLNILLESYAQSATADPQIVSSIALGWDHSFRGPQLISLGNICYSLAHNLVRSGSCNVLAARREEARRWLQAAEDSWRFITSNGTVAIAYRRLELDRLSGTIKPSRRLGRRLLALSRQFRRPLGHRRAAIDASRFGAPGDLDVRARLRELLVGAPPSDRAHLALGMALWYARAGSPRAAIRWAALSRAGLVPGDGSVILDTAAVIEAVGIEASSMSNLRRSGRPRSDARWSRDEELRTRTLALPAIARRLSSASTELAHQVAMAEVLPSLTAAIELAVRLNRLDVANTIMEVARRDTSGLLLSKIAEDPDVPAQIAALATSILQALAARPEADGDEDATQAEAAEGSEEEPAPREPSSGDDTLEATTRGAATNKNLDDAVNVLGEALGQVARTVFDPRTALTTGVTQLLVDTERDRAILSMWLVPDSGKAHRKRRRRARHGFVPAGTLYWTLATKSRGQTTTECGRVSVPASLVDLDYDASGAMMYAWMDEYGDLLLPAALQDFLLANMDPGDVPDLIIIPTGCLGIPFSALLLRDGRHLVEAAALSVVSSLTTALALHRETLSEPGSPIAVYDLTAFPAAAAELDELEANHGQAVRAQTLEELGTALDPGQGGSRPSLLAIALHGDRGRDGWSQAKRLPAGGVLSTAHVLTWRIPDLVVGASCNTDIRSDSAGRLGGFPLAFTLRGAHVVIGTLSIIEDAPTVQIVGTFYRRLAEMDAARALRAAQLAWLTSHPAADRAHWSLFVAYGVT